MKIKIDWATMTGTMCANDAAVQQIRGMGHGWRYDHFGRLMIVKDGVEELAEITWEGKI